MKSDKEISELIKEQHSESIRNTNQWLLNGHLTQNKLPDLKTAFLASDERNEENQLNQPQRFSPFTYQQTASTLPPFTSKQTSVAPFMNTQRSDQDCDYEVSAINDQDANQQSCPHCKRLQKNFSQYKEETKANLQIFKKKIVSTSDLLTEYHRKCQELEKEKKVSKKLKADLDTCYGQAANLRIQLEKTLQGNEPLKKTLIRMEKESTQMQADIEQYKTELDEKEAEIARLKKVTIESRLTQDTLRRETNETESKFDKEKKKVLSQDRLLDKLNQKIRTMQEKSRKDSKSLTALRKENEHLKVKVNDSNIDKTIKTRKIRGKKQEKRIDSPQGVLSPSPSPPLSSVVKKQDFSDNELDNETSDSDDGFDHGAELQKILEKSLPNQRSPYRPLNFDTLPPLSPIPPTPEPLYRHAYKPRQSISPLVLFSKLKKTASDLQNRKDHFESDGEKLSDDYSDNVADGKSEVNIKKEDITDQTLGGITQAPDFIKTEISTKNTSKFPETANKRKSKDLTKEMHKQIASRKNTQSSSDSESDNIPLSGLRGTKTKNSPCSSKDIPVDIHKSPDVSNIAENDEKCVISKKEKDVSNKTINKIAASSLSNITVINTAFTVVSKGKTERLDIADLIKNLVTTALRQPFKSTSTTVSSSSCSATVSSLPKQPVCSVSEAFQQIAEQNKKNLPAVGKQRLTRSHSMFTRVSPYNVNQWSQIYRRHSVSPSMFYPPSPPMSPIPPSPQQSMLTPIISPLPEESTLPPSLPSISPLPPDERPSIPPQMNSGVIRQIIPTISPIPDEPPQSNDSILDPIDPVLSPLPHTPQPPTMSPLPPSPTITSPPLIRGSALVQAEDSSIYVPTPMLPQNTVVNTKEQASSQVAESNAKQNNSMLAKRALSMEDEDISPLKKICVSRGVDKAPEGGQNSDIDLSSLSQNQEIPIITTTPTSISEISVKAEKKSVLPEKNTDDKDVKNSGTQEDQGSILNIMEGKLDNADDKNNDNKNKNNRDKINKETEPIPKKIPTRKQSDFPLAQNQDATKKNQAKESKNYNTGKIDKKIIHHQESSSEQQQEDGEILEDENLPEHASTDDVSSRNNKTNDFSTNFKHEKETIAKKYPVSDNCQNVVTSVDFTVDSIKTSGETNVQNEPATNLKVNPQNVLPYSKRDAKQPELSYVLKYLRKFSNKQANRERLLCTLRKKHNTGAAALSRAFVKHASSFQHPMLSANVLQLELSKNATSPPSQQQHYSTLHPKAHLFTEVLSENEVRLLQLLADLSREVHLKQLAMLCVRHVVNTIVDEQLLVFEVLALCRWIAAVCRWSNQLDLLVGSVYMIAYERLPHLNTCAILLTVYTVWPSVLLRCDLLANSDLRMVKLSPLSAALQMVAAYDAACRTDKTCLKMMEQLFSMKEGVTTTQLIELVEELFKLLCNKELCNMCRNTDSEDVMMNAYGFATLKALLLVCTRLGWQWTYNELILSRLIPSLQQSECHDTVAVLFRLYGIICEYGLGCGFYNFDTTIDILADSLAQCPVDQAYEGIHLSIAHALYDVAPSNGRKVLEKLNAWIERPKLFPMSNFIINKHAHLKRHYHTII